MKGPFKFNVMEIAEFKRNVYQVTVPDDVDFESILAPEAWAHIAMKLKPCDRIEVLSESGKFYAELFVVASAKLWAKVKVLHYLQLSEAQAAESEPSAPLVEYLIKWRGPTHRHCVVRASDNDVLKANCQTAEEAKEWLADHLGELAA